VLSLLVGLWSIPVVLAEEPSSSSTAGPDVVTTAIAIIEERLGPEVDASLLYQTAAQEVAGELDSLMGHPGNAVLTQVQLDNAEAWRLGWRDGIGVKFRLIAGQGLLVTDIIERSSAEERGLQKGDLIVGIDDRSLEGLDASGVLDCVQSQSESSRTLDYRRDSQLTRVVLERRPYQMHNMHLVREEGHPPVIELDFFGEDSSSELQERLRLLPDEGCVVLDLRDNQGGMLEEAIAGASFFLEPGSIVMQRVTFDGDIRTVTSNRARSWPHDVVVLVNGGTGGPAEAFTVALQGHRAATVVGTQTAGNAGLPNFHELGSGLILQLTDEFMRGPMGEEWSGQGLSPDVTIEPVDYMLKPKAGVAPPDLQRDAALRLCTPR
jgi:carboxyl-terminal processing protease